MMLLTCCFGMLDATLSDYSQDPRALLSLITFSALPTAVLFLSSSYNVLAQPAFSYLTLAKKAHREGLKDANLATFNCSVTPQFEVCDVQRHSLPFVLLVQPGLNNPQSFQQDILYDLQPGGLQKAIAKLYNLYSYQLRSEEDQETFLQQNWNHPRIIYLSTKTSSLRQFRVITGLFRHNVAFAHTVNYLPKIVGTQTGLFFDCQSRKFLQVGTMEDLQIYLSGRATTSYPEIWIGPKAQEQQDMQEEEFQDRFPLISKRAFESLMQVQQRALIFFGYRPDDAFEFIFSRAKRAFLFRIADNALTAEMGYPKNSILFLPASSRRKSVDKRVFHSLSGEQILEAINEDMEDGAVTLVDQNDLNAHTSQISQHRKSLSILFYEQEIPFCFKVLSNQPRLSRQILFFKMKRPSAKLREKLRLTAMPQMVVYSISRAEAQSVTIRVSSLPLSHVSYKDLLIHTAQYAPLFKSEFLKVNEIVQLVHPRQLSKLCRKGGCFLLLLDGSKSAQSVNMQLDQLRQASPLSPESNFLWIDGKCHNQILDVFDVPQDSLPALIFLNTQNKKFSRLQASLHHEPLLQFVQAAGKGTMHLRHYSTIKLSLKDCRQNQFQLPEVKDSREDDSRKLNTKRKRRRRADDQL